MNRRRPRSEVVLIGPPASGKSTIAVELCGRLSVPVVSLDELAKEFLPELGFNEMEAEARFARGFAHWRAYVANFEIQLLSVAMDIFKDCVFDLGAGYVVTDGGVATPPSPSQSLKDFANVVHVRPAAGPQAALMMCYDRLCRRGLPDVSHVKCMEIAKYFLDRDTDFERLATISVSTQNESPAKSADRIMKFLS